MSFIWKFIGVLSSVFVLPLDSAFGGLEDPDRQHAPEASAAEAAGSFWDLPLLEEAYRDTSPEDRGDGIPVGDLGATGANPHQIKRLAGAIAAGAHGNVDSLLIARAGPYAGAGSNSSLAGDDRPDHRGEPELSV